MDEAHLQGDRFSHRVNVLHSDLDVFNSAWTIQNWHNSKYTGWISSQRAKCTLYIPLEYSFIAPSNNLCSDNDRLLRWIQLPS